MTSRERVLLALAHKEPDRVPIDLGSTIVTGISATAYKNLISYWGLEHGNIHLMEITQQLAEVEEPMLKKVGADAVILWPEYPKGWKRGMLSDGNPCLVPEDFNPEIQSDGSHVLKNEDGTIILRMPKDGFYFDELYHPLQNVETTEEVEKFAWPYTASRDELDRLRKRAQYLSEKTEYAVVADTLLWGQIYEVLQHLRGWDTFVMDLAGNTKMGNYLLDKRLEVCLERFRQYFDTFDKYIDVIVVGDDLGMQDGPQISPELYRKMVKPRQKKLYAYIKSKTDAYLFLHACGSVYDFIPDYIEMGVDILNPVQVSARNMDSVRLKREFGRDITFWGGGCDTQRVLPLGSPKTVREEVRRRVGDFAPGGGFVFNTVHNIQPDVPVENLAAMYEAVQEFGQYS